MCDTLIALRTATANGAVVFGKNSDRPADEDQVVVKVPRSVHEPGARLRCTYIDIPQVRSTHAMILSQPTWMWGAEMGANEHGVVIGNEAVWTREPCGPPALLGMDLLRLGLERGASASEATETIIELLETHGQGGACAEGDPSFTYHNSFLIADSSGAWILETAGRHWVAERLTDGVRNISNALSIRGSFDRASKGLVEHATERGFHTAGHPFDFAASLSSSSPEPAPGSREYCAHGLLTGMLGEIDPRKMMRILGDHESGLCMHGGFATTASMVSELSPGKAVHWLTGAPFPCQAEFKRFGFDQGSSGSLVEMT